MANKTFLILRVGSNAVTLTPDGGDRAWRGEAGATRAGMAVHFVASRQPWRARVCPIGQRNRKQFARRVQNGEMEKKTKG